MSLITALLLLANLLLTLTGFALVLWQLHTWDGLAAQYFAREAEQPAQPRNRRTTHTNTNQRNA